MSLRAPRSRLIVYLSVLLMNCFSYSESKQDSSHLHFCNYKVKYCVRVPITRFPLWKWRMKSQEGLSYKFWRWSANQLPNKMPLKYHSNVSSNFQPMLAIEVSFYWIETFKRQHILSFSIRIVTNLDKLISKLMYVFKLFFKALFQFFLSY